MKTTFKNKPHQYVVDPGRDPRQYGPFKTGAAAVTWAEKNLGTSCNWAIKPLSNPF